MPPLLILRHSPLDSLISSHTRLLQLHPLPAVFLVEIRKTPPSGHCPFQPCVLVPYLFGCYFFRTDLLGHSNLQQVPLLDFRCINVHMCRCVLINICQSQLEYHLSGTFPPCPFPLSFWRQGLLLTNGSSSRPRKPSHLPNSVFPALGLECMILHLNFLCGFWKVKWVLALA